MRIQVTDGSAVPPHLRPGHLPDQIGGHGLHIVDQLADRWGVTPELTGKTVWSELGAELH
ncbi:ATP-binding protein [Kitasatospora sp. NPDC052896]|uniref:ATP-binding protein n=1 Tax=Kitasatospora sp. NPDC052896 TaxID=3364061 RepID=UPI0037C912DA